MVATHERVLGERGLVQRDGPALLPIRGRIDVWLELSAPGHLIEQSLAPAPETRLAHDVYVIDAGLGLLATLGFAGLARDAAQPG